MSQPISPVAQQLIKDVRGSDSGAPECGWAVLDQVVEIKIKKLTEGPPNGPYEGEVIERLALRLVDGSERIVYRRTAGYPEGYLCQITNGRPKKPMDVDWTETCQLHGCELWDCACM